ncbi:MAG TPA: large conductance mechanosensitive channel protein MscL [Polyangiaceae bacterium]|jgi:large conductance mechanosensitive channel
MSLFEDFKKFAFKGSAVDLAVGVVIGGAFGKIVSALVADLVMPFVSLFLPGGDWRTHGFILRHAADPKNDVLLKYGDFAGAVIDFLLVSFVLFIIVSKLIRGIELRAGVKSADPTTKECKYCLETIPRAATRCKACTSEQPPLEAKA